MTKSPFIVILKSLITMIYKEFIFFGDCLLSQALGFLCLNWYLMKTCSFLKQNEGTEFMWTQHLGDSSQALQCSPILACEVLVILRLVTRLFHLCYRINHLSVAWIRCSPEHNKFQAWHTVAGICIIYRS